MPSSWIEETTEKLKAEIPGALLGFDINAEVAVIFYPDIDSKPTIDEWRADAIVAVYSAGDEQRYYLSLPFTESDIRYISYLRTFSEELKSLLRVIETQASGLIKGLLEPPASGLVDGWPES